MMIQQIDRNDKLDVIKKFITDFNGNYVILEGNAVDIVYDIYNIIMNCTLEKTIFSAIGSYDGFPSARQYLPIVCLYIGFFCNNHFANSVEALKISDSYYKLSVEAGNCEAMRDLADSYYNAGKYDKAITYSRLAIESGDVNNSELYYELAEAYHKKADYGSAIVYYEMALLNGINHEHSKNIHHDMATAYFQKGDNNTAIYNYKLSMNLGLNCAIKEIGRVYCIVRNYNKAVKYFRKYIETLEPNPGNCEKCCGTYIAYSYESIFKENNDVNNLVLFYILKGDDIRIVGLLMENNTNHDAVGVVGSISDPLKGSLINYFINDPHPWKTALRRLIKHIIDPFLCILDLHFKYAVNSDGYSQTKLDFYKRASLD